MSIDKDRIKGALTVSEVANKLFGLSWNVNGRTSHPCIKCGSSDAVNVHSEDSAYCYSCHSHFDVFDIVGVRFGLEVSNKKDFKEILKRAISLTGNQLPIEDYRDYQSINRKRKAVDRKKQREAYIRRLEKAVTIYEQCEEAPEYILRAYLSGCRGLKLPELPENILYNKANNSLVITFFDKDGIFRGVQQTFLTSGFMNRKAGRGGNDRRVYGVGCDICPILLYRGERLKGEKVLFLTEGLEKAIAVKVLLSSSVNIASVYSTGAMKKSAPWIKSKGYDVVVIMADNDRKGQGFESASVLSEELSKLGIRSGIQMPKVEGLDWDDEKEARL